MQNMKINEKYHGVVVPMVTPVTKEGNIDTDAVERIIENFAKHNVSALIMGTTGEGNSVPVEQGAEMIKTAATSPQAVLLSMPDFAALASANRLKRPRCLLRQEPMSSPPLCRATIHSRQNRCTRIIKIWPTL